MSQIGPDTRSLVSVAHRNGMRLLKLVNTLLDFSRIEAGRVTASYEATNLAEYTAELASNFRSALDKAGLRLVIDADPCRSLSMSTATCGRRSFSICSQTRSNSHLKGRSALR